MGETIRRPTRHPDHRHVPQRAHPRRPAQLRRRPRRRLRRHRVQRAAGAARLPRRPPEDRHLPAPRRAHHRLRAPRGAAGRRSAGAVLVRHRAHHAAPDPLPHHLHQRAHARDHPRRARPLAAVQRPHPEPRAALLPVDRGQDRPLRRQGAPPDLPRAGGPRHRRGLPERPLDQPAAGCADRRWCARSRARGGGDHAARLRDRVRLRRPDQLLAVAGDQAGRAACTTPARSTAPPATRKRRRRA